ncbi:hypothetical protein A6P39_041055 [Streptomyces sp. FXJ1.172]|uniref:hypothetical protein n=1 Tax=Streptomyces sp. FXJ1.172 TaxID=710705 RepID=UPI0007CF9335|nr:hypothetical protein [Streptomyces sp. FXJ1.172]WEP00523.1 hypothetical protein A6P39_041055 [Streptomyces sp. FXJ1.172]
MGDLDVGEHVWVSLVVPTTSYAYSPAVEPGLSAPSMPDCYVCRVDWLVAATITLAHTASAERDADRMSDAAAEDALRVSLLRLFGATGTVDFSAETR